MRWHQRLFLGLSVTFLVLWLINGLLSSTDYFIMFQLLLPIPIGIFLFGSTGFFSFLLLYSYSIGKLNKIVLIITAIIGIVFLGLSGIAMGDYSYQLDQGEEYTLVVVEQRFLFAGEYTIYQKMNHLLAKKITTCESGEDFSCKYEIIDNILKVDAYYNDVLYKSEYVFLYNNE